MIANLDLSIPSLGKIIFVIICFFIIMIANLDLSMPSMGKISF
jgi:hypothetical protein